MSWFGRRRECGAKTDAELVEGIRRGDEACWREIYRRHHGPVYRYALYMSGSAEAAEDAVQEAYLTLLERPCRYDAALGSLGGWLLGIARKKVLKSAMAQGPDFEEFDRAAEGETALDALTREETRGAVREAVRALPEAYREVVALVEFEEMSYEEAAQALGVPLGTVRSRLSRARAMLAAELGRKRGAIL
jgi:RNA polymerase sigma-70 factor (ECF subfamily)